MDGLASLLAEAYQARPAMLAVDLMKLIYQRVFGPGHLIQDRASSLAYLEAEWPGAQGHPGDCLLEPIGLGFARLNLAVARQAGLALPLVHDAFLLSAAQLVGSAQAYAQETAVLTALCQAGRLPFPAAQVDDLLAAWQQGGQRPFSHSQAYRLAYRPAYRVLNQAGVQLLGLDHDGADMSH